MFRHLAMLKRVAADFKAVCKPPASPSGLAFLFSKPERMIMTVGFGLDDTNDPEFPYTDEQTQLLDNLLKTLPETLTVETKTFLKAILELERQEEIKAFCMLSAIRHMDMQLEKLKALLFSKQPLSAKAKLYQLFLSSDAWATLFTEDSIQQWQAEAESFL
jgi:hypothetical protein